MGRMRRDDPVSACLGFLEAAYAWQLEENVWLRRLAEAARRLWDRPRCVAAYVYDASGAGIEFGSPVLWGASAAIKEM
jgi:hypothetical protein